MIPLLAITKMLILLKKKKKKGENGFFFNASVELNQQCSNQLPALKKRKLRLRQTITPTSVH